MTIPVVLSACLLAESGNYYSEKMLEPDKLATAWLLKRYVDKDARFLLVPEDSAVANAVPFDMPTSKYRRTPRASAASNAIRHHNVGDPKAVRLSGLIDEIELDFWATSRSPAASALRDTLTSIMETEKDTARIFQRAFSVFDSLGTK